MPCLTVTYSANSGTSYFKTFQMPKNAFLKRVVLYNEHLLAEQFFYVIAGFHTALTHGSPFLDAYYQNPTVVGGRFSSGYVREINTKVVDGKITCVQYQAAGVAVTQTITVWYEVEP